VQQYPHISANFSSPAALDWLDAISESNAILSAILAVIHPNLYDAGWQTTKCLRDTPEICPQDVLSKWASVLSGVAVISNRSTLPHRDGSSRNNWYDILVTLGRYRNCNLELPGLGISLEYGPGTVVGISGKVVEHAVPGFEGDRVCYAYFMRNNVHEWAKVPGSDWMRTKYYE
jgi:Oxygenase domain of the 2OGFeDO superfamily